MLISIPGMFLVFMIVVTLILLPYMGNDRPFTEERRVTEEIQVRQKTNKH